MDNNQAMLVACHKINIADCLARIARGEDRRDAALLTSCFWPGAMIDFGIFRAPFEEYLGFVVPGDPSILLTCHTLGQSLIEIDGVNAQCETHLSSYHRVASTDGDIDMTIGGRYLDTLECRQGEWRVIKRTLIYDWIRHDGASADFSQGVLGTPFLEGNYVGSTDADPSNDFIGVKP